MRPPEGSPVGLLLQTGSGYRRSRARSIFDDPRGNLRAFSSILPIRSTEIELKFILLHGNKQIGER